MSACDACTRRHCGLHERVVLLQAPAVPDVTFVSQHIVLMPRSCRIRADFGWHSHAWLHRSTTYAGFVATCMCL